jgi:hypothetical protein
MKLLALSKGYPEHWAGYQIRISDPVYLRHAVLALSVGYPIIGQEIRISDPIYLRHIALALSVRYPGHWAGNQDQ